MKSRVENSRDDVGDYLFGNRDLLASFVKTRACQVTTNDSSDADSGMNDTLSRNLETLLEKRRSVEGRASANRVVTFAFRCVRRASRRGTLK